MSSRNDAIAIVIVLLVFAGYIIYDLSFNKAGNTNQNIL
jgi:hypothetical protein